MRVMNLLSCLTCLAFFVFAEIKNTKVELCWLLDRRPLVFQGKLASGHFLVKSELAGIPFQQVTGSVPYVIIHPTDCN